jgi:hypothetical protein
MSPADQLLATIPASLAERHIDASTAVTALGTLLRQIDGANTIAGIRKAQNGAKYLRELFSDVEEVRLVAERTILIGEHVIGGWMHQVPVSRGGRPKTGASNAPVSGPATIRELAGDKFYGLRLKRLANVGRDDLERAIDEIHAANHEATVVTVTKWLAGELSRKRREASRSAVPIVDGMDYRVGDAREVLDDVADNSVPLILTDPPYGDEAEPLYEWLAGFAQRKLIPGGSLICYTGQSRLDRDMAILSQRLTYWWLCIMPHGQAQTLPGKFVKANFKPVLWYVKDHRRGRTVMPDMLVSPKREKLAHDWAQGEGGVWIPIEHLTEPKELIVDPFAGTGAWGRIAAQMGRRWLGCDIAEGGTETIQADEAA